MDTLDFLDAPEGDAIVAPAVEQEPAVEPALEAAETPPAPELETDRPRDDQGRFAPKQTMVPLSVVEQERARRQAAEERVRSYEERQHVPDIYTDPEAFAQYQQQQTQQITLNVKLDLSEDMARSKHGDEAVDAARDWALGRFAQSPSYQQEILSQRNPYEAVVSAYKREQMLADLSPEDLEQFRAWKATGNPLQSAAHPPQAALAARPQPVAPSRSIASTPAAGSAKPGEQPVGPGVAFDGLFTR